MLYALELGPVEQTIIQQCVNQRLPLPDKIANAPQLSLGLELYYSAFMDLTTCRNLGTGEGPIPWVAIKQWADEYNVEGEQRDDLFYYVRQMDEVYLTHMIKKIKEASKQGAK